MEKVKKSSVILSKIKGFLKRHVRLAVTFALLVCIAGGAVMIKAGSSTKRSGMPEFTINTVNLSKQNVVNSISLTGTIASANSEAISTNLSNIEIKEVLAAVGDMVDEGQVICVFDSSDIEEDLENTQKSLNADEGKNSISLQSAERNLQNAQETAAVQAERAEDNVNKSYSEYEDAVNEEENAQNTYASAQEDTESKSNAVTKAQKAADKAQKAYDKARSALTAAGSSISDEEIAALRETWEKAQAEYDAYAAAGNTDEAGLAVLKEAADKAKAALEAKQQAKAGQDLEKAGLQETVDEKETALKEANEVLASAQAAYEAAKQTENTRKQELAQVSAAVSAASDSYEKAVEDQEDTARNNANSVASQQENLANTKISVSTSTLSTRSQVREYEEQLGKCVVTAPFAGVITNIPAVAGEMYTGGELFTIQDTASFIAKVDVDEYDIADIAKNMSAVVKTDATGEEELTGTVTFVSPAAESGSSAAASSTTQSASSASAVYPVEITLEDSSERLRIGMTAKISVLTESREDVFAVPYECVQENEAKESVIYVLDAQSTAADEKQEEESQSKVDGRQSTQKNGVQKEIVVEVGLESDYYVEISGSELKEGMKVIVPTTTKAGTGSTQQDTMQIGGMMPGGGSVGGRSGQKPGGF